MTQAKMHIPCWNETPRHDHTNLPSWCGSKNKGTGQLGNAP